MPFSALPSTAAWRHHEVRDGFEVVFFSAEGAGWRIEGHTSAIEDGVAWAVRYAITVDDRWRTRSARVVGRSAAGLRERHLEADGEGRWRVDGIPAPELEGCLDVDLESSACTNTLPIHRRALAVGEMAAAPAAYVRADGLGVSRLEQHYTRVPDPRPGTEAYDYAAPAFAFTCRLTYDDGGLVVAYPGLAIRVA
jgi:hypothetical protein